MPAPLVIESQIPAIIERVVTKRASFVHLGETRWTHADLRELPESNERIEILDGTLIVSPSPHIFWHQQTVLSIATLLHTHVRERDLGTVFISPADVRFTESDVVQPDVFFVRKDRLHLVDAYMDGAPDLAVEVLSPSTKKHDGEHKRALFARHGVAEYWLVEPREGWAEVLRLEEGGYAVHSEASTDGSRPSLLRSAYFEGLEVDLSTLLP
jgi:Uma2 family endonuclease